MIYVEGPAAAVAIMPNLICYCSMPTVPCIWYIDFLPPTLFGVSCRCVFFLFVCLEFEEGVQSSEHSSPGCDIRMEVYGSGITTAQHPKLNSPLGPNPLRLEVGIGEHAADWAACSLVVLHFPSLFRRSSVQIALPLFCTQQIMAMTRLQMLSCLPDAG